MTGVFGGQGRRIVVVIPFADQRSIQNRCGMKKNGYNMDTANLLCSEAPARWLAELLTQELRKSGFDATLEPPSPDPGDGLRIEGTLLRLFVEPLIGFITVSGDAEMHVELHASSKSGLVATRSFFARTSRSSVVGTLDIYQEALDSATQQMIREMVSAILALINRYPEISLELLVAEHLG